MDLPVGIRGRLTALALLFIALVLLAQYAVRPLLARYGEIIDDIATSQEAIGRYQRIIAELPALKAATARLERSRPLAPFLLPGDNAALAVANLQQRLQTVAKQHGVRIVSVRVLDPADDGPLERIALQARLQAGNQALRDTLYELEAGTPFLFVEALTINGADRRRKGARDRLDAQLTLAGMRAPAALEAGNG